MFCFANGNRDIPNFLDHFAPGSVAYLAVIYGPGSFYFKGHLMARGRIIDREMYSHIGLGELPIECRYLYSGLIIWADDEGRLKAHPRYLKAKIFPYDNLSETKVKQMVDQLATNGFIHIYNVKNQDYIEHSKWNQWQTIRKDRFHPSDCPSPENGSISTMSPYVNQLATNGLPPVDQVPPEPNLTKPNPTRVADATFDHFWNQYPKKKAKPDAKKAWDKLRPGDELLRKILDGLEHQKGCEDWTKDNGKFIPYPASWLNGRRWEDEIHTVPQKEFVI